MKLEDYIDRYFNGSRADFARAQSTTRQQVNKWLVAGFIVIDDTLLSPRRKLVRNGSK